MIAISSSRPSNSSLQTARPAARNVRIAAGMFVAALAGVALAAGVASAADPVDAAALWAKNCQSCHGADGKGKTKIGEKMKVRDLSSPEVKAKLTKAKALDSMKIGVKEVGTDKVVMKPYADKLSAAEIEALADYSLAFK